MSVREDVKQMVWKPMFETKPKVNVVKRTSLAVTPKKEED